MQKKLFTLFLCLAGALNIYAQQASNPPGPSKFGKVDLSEFQTKVSGVDSAARGVKLFDVGRCYFEINNQTGSFAYVFERHVRYKVLNKTGYDLADYEIGLYKSDGNAKESLEFMDAAAYNLENDKIVVSKLNKDAKFTERQNENRTIKKFTLPNVKEGSIIEYRYKIKSDFIYTLRDWYFQSSVPTLYSEYSIKIPSYFRYKMPLKGYFPVEQLQPEEINENFYVANERGLRETVQDKVTAYKYIAKNVNALKDEPFTTSIEDYVSKIEFEISSTRFPGSPVHDYGSTWPKIVKGLMEDENFGGFFMKSRFSKDLLPSIVKQETNPEAQMSLILNYVKANIKWNDENSKYSTVSQVKTIFDKKSGNSADINLSLLSLLRAANIKASPVLLSTRDNGTHPGYPLLTKFNNVIVAVEIADKTILLDATDKFLSPDIIAFQNLNHEGLKLDADLKTAAWISLEPLAPANTSIYYDLVLHEDHRLTGSLFLSYQNYDALRQRNKFTSALNEAAFLKDYKSGKPGLEVKNISVKHLDNPSEMLVQTMEVEIEDKAEEAGNLVLLSPLLFEQTKENPFKLEERLFPVDFAYPQQEVYRVLITYPKNYQLEKLPDNGKIKLQDDGASFTYSFSTGENQIAITSKILIGKTVFSPEAYHDLKELFRMIVEKQAQQIVFKKI